jgi:flagellar hook-associated protein 2
MSSSTSAIFTGSSQFSNDFQQVITRAVSIASMPMQQMQTTVASLQSQSTELNTLSSSFTALQTAIKNLQSALGLGSYSGSSSTATVASVALSGTPCVGTFSVEVDGLGSYSRAMTNDGLATVTDPTKTSISDSSSFTLSVGSSNYTITPATNTLSDLVAAINLNGDANVQATVVDVGSASAHDYRLSLQSIKYGELPLRLVADQGSNAGQTLLATSFSSDGLITVTDPDAANISDASSYTLKVGDTSYTVTPDDSSLTGLADAINQQSDGTVQASVVNAGTDVSPDYRLSLQSSSLAGQTIQLSAVDGSQPDQTLVSTTNGQPVTYRINGKPDTPIVSDTRAVSISPGVSVSLLATGNTDISVTRNTNAVSSALSSLVTAYNAAQKEINSNRGSGTGALQGDGILSALSSTLASITGYSSGSSGISSLTALGVKFDETFALTFDADAFESATSGQIGQLTDFLGSSTTGGFLKAATDALNGVTDSKTGIIPVGIASLKDQIDNDNQAISDQQDRVNDLQDRLNEQMAAADAAIAAMEQEYTYFSQMFEQMRVNASG